MKLRKCLELGKNCGLKTVGEAHANVELHIMSLFKYSEITKEMNEINIEYNELYKKGLLNGKMTIEEALKIKSLKE